MATGSLATNARQPLGPLLGALSASVVPHFAAPIHLPATSGRFSGATTRATTRPDHDGDGYVTNFLAAGDAVTFRVPVAAAGVYDVRLRYCSSGGFRGVTVRANGVGLHVMFPQTGDAWETFDAGRVELAAGDNEVSVGGGWGHYDLDSVDLTPSALSSPPPVRADLCDPLATPATRRLMARLVASAGSTTLAGGYGEADDAYVAAHAAGRRPAVHGADLMDFSPSRVARGSDPSAVVADVLRHAADGQAITLSWHWNAPAGLVDAVGKRPDGTTADRRWYKGFDADATTFDVAAAVADEHSAGYQLLLADIDAIAVPLQRLADAGVPVLWRPLHEADGGWFWWGAHGPGPYVRLWRLMHDRLTRVHRLHNLAWVYSCSTIGDPRWYPGPDVVDVVGVDAYPSDDRDPLGQVWQHWSAAAPAKPLAVTEFGGVPDVARMHRLGYPWLYFVSWTAPEGPAKTGPAEVGRRYADGHVGDLAGWRTMADRVGR